MHMLRHSSAALQSYSSCALLHFTHSPRRSLSSQGRDDRALLVQHFDVAAYTFEQVNDGKSVFSPFSPCSAA